MFGWILLAIFIGLIVHFIEKGDKDTRGRDIGYKSSVALLIALALAGGALYLTGTALDNAHPAEPWFWFRLIGGGVLAFFAYEVGEMEEENKHLKERLEIITEEYEKLKQL